MKKFETIFDYAPCKAHALSLLQNQPVAAEAFFKQLDPIKSKVLTDYHKQLLVKTFVNCRLLHPEEPLSMIPDFIHGATQFKQEVSVNDFVHMFSKLAQTDEDAQLVHYIAVCQGAFEHRGEYHTDGPFYSVRNAPWCQKKLPLSWKVNVINLFDLRRWSLIANNLKALRDEAFLRMYKTASDANLEEILTRFETPSELVQFPMSAGRIIRLRRQYQTLLRREEDLFTCSEAQLKEMYDAQQWHTVVGPYYQIKLLAILRHAVRLIIKDPLTGVGKYPYVTQMLAIMGVVFDENPQGCIAQVRTGEGKSTIFAMLVAYYAVQKKRVHWVTSSEDLALRDYEEAKPLFDFLGISIACISHDKENKKYPEQVLVGTNCNFEFMVLRDALRRPKDRQLPPKQAAEPWVAVVDEIDTLIDSAGNSARLASQDPNPKPWIYRPLVEFVRLLGKGSVYTSEVTTQLRETLQTIQGRIYHQAVAELSEEKLKQLFNSAHAALYELHREEDYDVIKDKATNQDKIEIVDKGHTGAVKPGMRWGQGKHECVEVKEGFEPQPETVTQSSISHAAYFNRFYKEQGDLVVGLTGTMGGVAERQFIKEIYGLDCFDVPPHRVSRRAISPPLLFQSEASLLEHLLRKVQEHRANEGFPILSLTQTIKSSKALHQFLRNACIPAQLLNDRQVEDKAYVVSQAGHPKMVTVATNVASRGTDIRLKGGTNNPGLLLFLTFFPENIRVQEQIYGRAARQGQPGKCSMLIHLEDPYMMQLIPNQATRQALLDDPNFMDRLEKARTQHIQTSYKKMSLIVRRDRILSDIPFRFASLYQAYLACMDDFPVEQLAEICATLNTEPLISHELPECWHAIARQGQALRKQQEAGLTVAWLGWIETCKACYDHNINQRWSVFFSSLQEIPLQSEAHLMAYEREILERLYQFSTEILVPLITRLPQCFGSTCLKFVGVTALAAERLALAMGDNEPSTQYVVSWLEELEKSIAAIELQMTSVAVENPYRLFSKTVPNVTLASSFVSDRNAVTIVNIQDKYKNF